MNFKTSYKSISYLSDIEHDRKGPPDLETVKKMEEVLGIAAGKLMDLANKLRKNELKSMSQRIKMKPELSELLLRADKLSSEDLTDLIDSLGGKKELDREVGALIESRGNKEG